MRKILLSVAAAGAALIVATPAAAQYRPAPQPAPYGNRYAYNGYGEIRGLQMRIDHLERQIRRLDRRDVIRGRSADRLLDEAQRIERRLHERARGGLNPREAGQLTYRVQRLEQQVQVALNDRGRRWDRDDRRDRDHDRD